MALPVAIYTRPPAANSSHGPNREIPRAGAFVSLVPASGAAPPGIAGTRIQFAGLLQSLPLQVTP
jgi:hypothetical protein